MSTDHKYFTKTELEITLLSNDIVHEVGQVCDMLLNTNIRFKKKNVEPNDHP